jgi:hypothetical protein
MFVHIDGPMRIVIRMNRVRIHGDFTTCIVSKVLFNSPYQLGGNFYYVTTRIMNQAMDICVGQGLLSSRVVSEKRKDGWVTLIKYRYREQ